MLPFVARRVLLTAPSLFGITLLTFMLLRLAPGDPGAMMVATDASVPEVGSKALDAWQSLKGLDRSLPVQYGAWLQSLARLDFGHAFLDDRPVLTHIAQALPQTLLLTCTALLLSYLLAVPIGLVSALSAGQLWEKMLSGLLFGVYAVPVFWMALLFIILFSGGEYWQLFPLQGLSSPGLENAALSVRVLDTAWHLVLPVTCLCYPSLVRTARYQRSALLEVLREDYVRTARAKGLSPRVVLLRHGLRQALRPTVTLLSVDLPWIIGGSVVIERIFAIRGMGMLTFEAILRRDYPIIMGITCVVAVGTVLALTLGDILLAMLDPRVREGFAR